MNRILILTLSLMGMLILLAGIPIDAQDCYWPTFADFTASRSRPADVRMEQFKFRKKAKHLGGDYKVECHDRATRKAVYKARFLRHGCSLFINLRDLHVEHVRFGGYFSPCFPIDSTVVVFVAVRLSDNIVAGKPDLLDYLLSDDLVYDSRTGTYEDSDLLTKTGNFLLEKKRAKRKIAQTKAVYYYSSVDGDRVRHIDRILMHRLLGMRLDLMDEYDRLSPAMQRSPEVILGFLDRAGVIRQNR